MKKKRHTVSPEAAKILEQYRNAGKPKPLNEETDVPSPDGQTPARPTAPPPAPMRQRSGNRGK